MTGVECGTADPPRSVEPTVLLPLGFEFNGNNLHRPVESKLHLKVGFYLILAKFGYS